MQRASLLYQGIVVQARSPVFFASLGVPDTPDGRFEMIVIHAALVLRRLRAHASDGTELSQRLFDVMFNDMDRSLRELGVGDLSVGKYVKKMAQGFYARAHVVEGALRSGERGGLGDMLGLDLYATGTAPTPNQIAELVRYVFEQAAYLDTVPVSEVAAGRLRFMTWAPPVAAE